MRKTLAILLISGFQFSTLIFGNTVLTEKIPVNSPTDYAEKMAQSEMILMPEIWMVDFQDKPKWDYTPGLIAKAYLNLYNATGVKVYYKYAHGLVDQFIEDNGNIATYKMSDYNIDKCNPGRALLEIYHQSSEEKVKWAFIQLREQLRNMPRTNAGTLWHKKIYP
ncbi:MAG: glycoside hydrolase family 88 protein, partial [Bacteroidales bacterium]|nr:glycoside hydrolase family 88 protein [Bacteroidales bacterium]